MRHRIIAGTTGSGKTNLLVHDLLEAAATEQYWITAVFPHAEWGIRFIAELYARLGTTVLDRLVVQVLSDMDAVVMSRIIRSDNNPNLFIRMQKNDQYAGGALDALGRRRGLSDFAETPVLEKGAKLGIRLAQNQDQWFPEHLLPFAFNVRRQERDYFIRHCTDEEVREEFIRMKSFPLRDQLAMLEPVERLFAGVFRNPSIIARTCKPATWNKKEFRNRQGIEVIIGGDISDDALRVFVGTDYQKTCFDAKDGDQAPGIYATDEVNNYHLCGNFESKSFSTMRAFGVNRYDVVQSLDYDTPEIRFNVLQNTDHYWLRQGSFEMAEEAARDVLGAMSEFKVHHEEETLRQLHMEPDYQERVTRGSWHPKEGHGGGFSKNTSIVPVSRYRDVVEKRKVYQPGHEQILWNARDFLEKLVGSCTVREMGRAPYTVQVPLVNDSWGFPGLAQAKVEECLQLLKSTLPIYEAPVENRIEVPRAATTTSMRKNATRRRKDS